MRWWRSSAKSGQIDRAAEAARCEVDKAGGAFGGPAAVGAVEPELLLEVRTRQRLVRAAAEMRLALLVHLAVLHPHAHVAGELIGVRVVGVDLVAHLGGDRTQPRVAHALLGEGIEPGMAEHEAGGDAVGLAELGGVGVGRLALGRERFPQAVHRAFPNLADDFLYLVQIDFWGQSASAVDVRMSHGAASVDLEGERLGDPPAAEAPGELAQLALRGTREAVEEAMGSLEHGARADEPRAREVGGADARLRCPAGVQPLGPGAF